MSPRGGAAKDEPVTQLWADSGAGRPPSLENHLGGEEARNYRRYEYDDIAPHVVKSLLKKGYGLGDVAAQCADRVSPLIVSDGDPYCLEQLAKHFAERPDIEVLNVLLPDAAPTRTKVDTIVAMNVLEHV